jgi:hypothetical protein
VIRGSRKGMVAGKMKGKFEINDSEELHQILSQTINLL